MHDLGCTGEGRGISCRERERKESDSCLLRLGDCCAAAATLELVCLQHGKYGSLLAARAMCLATGAWGRLKKC